jgi:hypothetical protein
VRRVVGGLQDVAGVADVLQCQREEDLSRVVGLLEQLLQILVVGVPLRERLLEDRRVRRHARDGILVHHPGELTRLEEVARERVEPDRLPVLGELMQR